jgi:hypothetical protein
MDEFTYVINFENLATATAPAQEVWVFDTLDLKVFDINTFEAGFIKIGDKIAETPPYLQNYTWTVAMPEKNLITKVELKLNKTTGEALWYFKCIDPLTGELPVDALAGFLPPEDGTGAGQGLVLFSNKIKNGLPDDVVVTNKAKIVFDYNDPIWTDPWENKKDIIAPTSKVLTATSISGGLVELKWQGTDNPNGSGVYCYDVYMKRQDEDYYGMLFSHTTETSAKIELEIDRTYSFYTIATDSADNQEYKTNIPDVTMFHTTSIEEVIKSGAVSISPNPAKNDFTVSFDVLESSKMKIVLQDLNGREVLGVYDGFVSAGLFAHAVKTDNFARGVYFLHISIGGNAIVEKVIVE